MVADTPEAARAGAEALRISYETSGHDVLLTEDHPGLYTPETVNGGYPAVRERGDTDRAFATAPVQIDATYTVGALHNHPMEPHATTARWDEDGHLTVHDSSQGSTTVRDSLATAFGIRPQQITAVSEHVGGGFGSKGTPRPQTVLAVMAARHTRRPVKVALPRRQMAALVGHRAPTIQHVRLGADLDGTLTAVDHEIITHTSTVKEFVEQAAVPTRIMYGSGTSRTAHRVVALDVPSPSWMRAPGEAPGMYALESAMDELASALGMDPVELRIRNDPANEPDSGRAFSSRGLAACLEKGAARFGWYDRDPRPAIREEGPLLLGTGVAAATYPVYIAASSASAHAAPDGSYRIRVNATDIGTGARTVLAQIAADVLDTPWTTSGSTSAAANCPTPPGGRILGHGLLGLVRAQGMHPVAPAAGRTHRPGPRRGAHRHRRHPAGDRAGIPVRTPRVRRALRRSRRARTDRRSADAPDARRLRRRTHPQLPYRTLPVHRRHDHGDRHGADRGQRRGPRLR